MLLPVFDRYFVAQRRPPRAAAAGGDIAHRQPLPMRVAHLMSASGYIDRMVDRWLTEHRDLTVAAVPCMACIG
jgi:hypothetical protein